MNPILLDCHDRSIDRLKSIFESAGFECEIDDDGDLRIADDLIVFLQFWGDRLLRFVSMYRLKDDADESRASELASRIDASVPFVKARLSMDFRILTISWFVNAEVVRTARDLVPTLRKFQERVRTIEFSDHDDLLE